MKSRNCFSAACNLKYSCHLTTSKGTSSDIGMFNQAIPLPIFRDCAIIAWMGRGVKKIIRGHRRKWQREGG